MGLEILERQFFSFYKENWIMPLSSMISDFSNLIVQTSKYTTIKVSKDSHLLNLICFSTSALVDWSLHNTYICLILTMCPHHVNSNAQLH